MTFMKQEYSIVSSQCFLDCHSMKSWISPLKNGSLKKEIVLKTLDSLIRQSGSKFLELQASLLTSLHN